MPTSGPAVTSRSLIGSLGATAADGASRSPSTIAPIRSRIRRKPVRVQLTPTSRTTSREPFTSTPAAIMNAADDEVAGHDEALRVELVGARRPTPSARRARTATPAPASIRSVWSRLGAGSTTLVVPAAASPASSTQDFTCALATGIS